MRNRAPRCSHGFYAGMCRVEGCRHEERVGIRAEVNPKSGAPWDEALRRKQRAKLARSEFADFGRLA
jgi:hypothetical protein